MREGKGDRRTVNRLFWNLRKMCEAKGHTSFAFSWDTQSSMAFRILP
jgi:hypothetical protein